MGSIQGGISEEVMLFRGALLLFVLATASPVMAFQVPWPQDEWGRSYHVSSAFGPRMLDEDSFNLHEAVDFAGPPYARNRVRALEAGTVQEVLYLREGSYRSLVWVTVNGEHMFRYLHLFRHSDAENFRLGNANEIEFTLTPTLGGIQEKVRLTRLTFRPDPVTGQYTRQLSGQNAIVNFQRSNDVSPWVPVNVHAAEALLLIRTGSRDGPPVMSMGRTR